MYKKKVTNQSTDFLVTFVHNCLMIKTNQLIFSLIFFLVKPLVCLDLLI